MPAASTPWEAPIPLSPVMHAQIAEAEQALAPNAGAKTHTALRKLLWLFIYVTLMRLLGYRMPRQPTSAAERATPRQNPTPATEPTAQAPTPPRQKPRYLDRAKCLALLASINADLARPAATALAALPPPAPRTPHAVRTRTSTVPRLARPAPPPARRSPRVAGSPRFQKPQNPSAPTHAQFVTIS